LAAQETVRICNIAQHKHSDAAMTSIFADSAKKARLKASRLARSLISHKINGSVAFDSGDEMFVHRCIVAVYLPTMK
jgi:hypothetical protein